MAEGLFRIRQFTSLVLPVTTFRSVLRLDTGRQLEYELFFDEEAAKKWTGFTVASNGAETFRWGLTDAMLSDLDLAEESEDWSDFISHELVAHLRTGGTLPYKTEWKGTGSCVVISSKGYILTNQHLVSGPQKAHQLTEEAFDPVGYRCPSLSIQSAEGKDLGSVFICYSSSALDLAILRLETSVPLHPVHVNPRSARWHQRCWMFGFPCRTVRPKDQCQQFGYDNANYELRGSVGLLVAKKDKNEWLSDCDAGPGSSGSPVFGDDGSLIGLYRGTQGNGVISSLVPISGMTHPAARLKRIVNIPHLIGRRLPREAFES